MLNFDFSEAKLKKWDTILPWGGPLFMEEVGWDQGTFLAHFYMLNDPKGFKVDQERVFNVFRLKCKPEFALLVKDEVYGLSLSHELGSKENDKIRGHAIVEDSLWISSFLKSEGFECF